MSRSEWVEREIELGCKRENPNWDGKSFDYGCSCYQSALKAYKSLCEDGHSGFSFSATRSILEKLLYEIPLTPIEDNEEDWNEVTSFYGADSKNRVFQCKRRSSLFKNVNEYGEVFYNDNNRALFYELNNKGGSHFKIADKVVEEYFPIKMPYIPKAEPFKVYGEEFLSDKKNGDFDMAAIFYIKTPDCERVEVNRYFDLRGAVYMEISEREYFYIKQKCKEGGK